MEIIEKVKELLEPIAAERGYAIVDITYSREAGNNVLRILADREGGITMAECASLNNELSELLDKDNMIDEEYLLEVSSPGLDRRLKTDTDFVWAIGKKVRISTYMKLEGKSEFQGIIVGLGDGTVVLQESGISYEIPSDKIASARLSEANNE
jgi:ribosome maturation factor RimP